jgi:hypothetical protein
MAADVRRERWVNNRISWRAPPRPRLSGRARSIRSTDLQISTKCRSVCQASLAVKWVLLSVLPAGPTLTVNRLGQIINKYGTRPLQEKIEGWR